MVQSLSPTSQQPAPARARSSQPCPRCGGSGMLRLDDQRFRTCLDCLGQGQLPALSESNNALIRAITAGKPASVSR